MTTYYVRLEFPGVDLTDDLVDHLMGELDHLHPSISEAPRSAVGIRLALPAESAAAAIRTAIPAASLAFAGGPGVGSAPAPTVVEAMTEAEFDAREGYVPVPELVGVAEAAEALGVSPQRVRQMIEEKKFTTARRVGERTYVLARSEVDVRSRHSR